MADPKPTIRHVFCFMEGALTVVLGDGYAGKGDGWFTFDEDVIEWHPHDEKSGNYLLAKVAKAELLEMRDFLNKRFPP